MKKTLALFAALMFIGAGCNNKMTNNNPQNNKLAKTETNNTTGTVQTSNKNKDLTTVNLNAQSKIVESGYRIDLKTITDENGKFVGVKYLLVSPEKKETALNLKMEKKINEPDETISNIDVPFDPKNPDILFLSTYKEDTGSVKFTSKIYSFNIKTNELKELYKMEDKPKQPENGTILKILGREDSKIIVVADGVDNSSGPCFNFWASYSSSNSEHFKYFDWNAQEKVLQNYTVPQEKIDSGKKQEAACNKQR
jgi:hypothetical protein